MDSIICNDKCCYICGTTYNLEKHHCLHGTANRKQADKYGLWVYLCKNHHTVANDSVHFNRPFDVLMMKIAQMKWEETYGSREEFRNVFGKSHL